MLALSKMAVPTLDIFLELLEEMGSDFAFDGREDELDGKNSNDCEEAEKNRSRLGKAGNSD